MRSTNIRYTGIRSYILLVFVLLLPPVLYAETDSAPTTESSALTEDAQSEQEITEQARERENSAEEDPQAQRQADRVDRPLDWSEDPNELRLYGSIRLRYRETDNDSVWGDGGSRFGLSGRKQYKPRTWLAGRVEMGVNLLDQVDLLINRGGAASDTGFSDTVFLRLAYIGVETTNNQLTLGKNWSTYYRVTSFTDRFQGTGASASGTFNAGTDGGPTGTGRADGVIQTRFLMNALAKRLGLKPFKLNVQAQYGQPIPNVPDEDYQTTVGLSALLETRDDLTIGLAYNYANIDHSALPKLKTYGITGDATAASLGIRWFSENWYLATVLARLKNHETTNEDIYFEGWGWEVYSQYNVYQRWWAVAGWNILEPDEDQVQAGEFNTKYGVIGVRYSFDAFRQFLFANVRLDSGNAQDGTPLGNIYTVGVRWDLP